jgi:signal peptide peptidase SppA
MIPYHHLADLLYNRPLLLAPDTGETIASFLLGRMRAHASDSPIGEKPIEDAQMFEPTTRADGSIEMHSPRASRFVGTYPTDDDGRPAPFRLFKADGAVDGVAIVTIVGELVNRGAWIGASSRLVSYKGIKHQVSSAANDPRVRSILLDVQSPGGEAIGAFDCAMAIRRAAQKKPVTAFINGVACSGGYALVSGATRIVIIPEGVAGHIGVLWVHLDVSVALQMEGVKPTIIYSGAHKVDGNPFEPLPKDVRERRQHEINSLRDMFAECVVAGRTKLTTADVLATEALTYRGKDAVSVGLADAVGTFDDLLAEMSPPPTRHPARKVNQLTNLEISSGWVIRERPRR